MKERRFRRRVTIWMKAAGLYERAAKSSLDKEMVEKAAGAYKKVGYVYYRAGRTAETAEEYVELSVRIINPEWSEKFPMIIRVKRSEVLEQER